MGMEISAQLPSQIIVSVRSGWEEDKQLHSLHRTAMEEWEQISKSSTQIPH